MALVTGPKRPSVILTVVTLGVLFVVGLLVIQFIAGFVQALIQLALVLVGLYLLIRVGLYLVRKGGPTAEL